MKNIFTIEAIKATPTYRSFESKGQSFKTRILEQREVRKRITHAYNVWCNTGGIPSTVRFMELDIVKDLINQDCTDRAFDMSCESINLSEDEK